MAAQARGAGEGRPLTAKAVIEHVHEQVPHRDELVVAQHQEHPSNLPEMLIVAEVTR